MPVKDHGQHTSHFLQHAIFKESKYLLVKLRGIFSSALSQQFLISVICNIALVKCHKGLPVEIEQLSTVTIKFSNLYHSTLLSHLCIPMDINENSTVSQTYSWQ